MNKLSNITRALPLLRPALMLALVLPLVVAGGPGTAQASRLTDIVDGFSKDSIGGTVGIGFDYWKKSGLITREFKCVSHDSAGKVFCPNGSQVLDRKEMIYDVSWQQLVFSAEVSFFRVASVGIRLPYILQDQTDLALDEGIDGSNSSVMPNTGSPQLFFLDSEAGGTKRSGIGDLEVNIKFAPMSLARDETHPNWTIGIDLIFPTSELREAGNAAPGGGLWQIELSSALSARFMPWFEPYFRLAGNFRVTGSGTFFEEFGNTQTLAAPGHQLKIGVGFDLLPYENMAKEEFFIIDIGADLMFQFEGREQTVLFEALGNSSCDPSTDTAACDLTTFTRGDIDPLTAQRRKTDGLTDIEQYALVRGTFGFRWQMWKHIQLRFTGWLGFESSHFLTTADAGKDLDSQNQVEASNSQCVAGSPPLAGSTCGCSQCVNEYNPVYNDAYDSLGTRFRTANTTLWGVNVQVQGKF